MRYHRYSVRVNLRNLWLKKGVTPFDIRQGFKTNFIYELPVGKGKMFMSNSHGLMNALVGGWGFNGTAAALAHSGYSPGRFFAALLGASEVAGSCHSSQPRAVP